METIHYISSDLLSIEMINEIVFQGKQLALSEEAIVNIEKCRKYLDDKMKSNSEPIYGINTGFGSLCNVKISNENLSKLQENLVKSHACGTGDEVPHEIVKIMLLLKIQSLSYGHSGVQLITVQRLIDFYNNDILPVIYTQGSLGASGDLAHIDQVINKSSLFKFKALIHFNLGFIKLKKHNAKVTSILYPHAEHPRYDPTMLVTGSLDFSIILWNINTGEMVHRFVVQTGEILQLSVPPNNVNPRILQCICSIASDHSVALLSLKECKPVMVASRHLFPVLFIKWRPLDDYLLVKCSDGGVFVWQIETGNLDRVAHGLLAEDILSAADELVISNEGSSASILITPPVTNTILNNQIGQSSSANPANTMIVSNKLVANQTIALAHILQKRNYLNAAKVLGQKIAPVKDEKRAPTIDTTGSMNFPIVIQPFHLSPNDPVNHLLLFDIDSLLSNLTLNKLAF